MIFTVGCIRKDATHCFFVLFVRPIGPGAFDCSSYSLRRSRVRLLLVPLILEGQFLCYYFNVKTAKDTHTKKVRQKAHPIKIFQVNYAKSRLRF